MSDGDGKGNHQLGIRRGSGVGGLRWEKDPQIMKRLHHHWQLWAEGKTKQQIMEAWNASAKAQGFDKVSIHTVTNDRKRIEKLYVMEDEELRKMHIETLRLVIQEAFDAFRSTQTSSLNRSAYLNTIRSTVELMARMDGSLTRANITPETEKSGKVEIVFVNNWRGNQELETIEANEYKALGEAAGTESE